MVVGEERHWMVVGVVVGEEQRSMVVVVVVVEGRRSMVVVVEGRRWKLSRQTMRKQME